MTNTIIKDESLIPILSFGYELTEPVSCQLIRRGFNDNYLVKAAEQRYVLRIYLNDKYYIYDSTDFRFELELLTFLSTQGIPVARPITNRDGELLMTIDSPAGTRYMVLFHFVEGKELEELEELQENLQEAEARQLGKIVAAFHRAADKFHSNYSRYHLNLKYLIDEPVRLLEKHLIDHGKGDLAFFQPFVEEIRQQIKQLPVMSSVYGIIHSDLISHNIYYDHKAGFTIIDFDHCAYGWRAYDLAILRKFFKDYSLGAAFLEAYESIRPLSDWEKSVMPVFAKVRTIWDIGDILSMFPVWGKESTDEYLENSLKRLRNLI
jgi:Ser/Thr protein kinase RdoA (MazF antagonist)